MPHTLPPAPDNAAHARLEMERVHEAEREELKARRAREEERVHQRLGPAHGLDAFGTPVCRLSFDIGHGRIGTLGIHVGDDPYALARSFAQVCCLGGVVWVILGSTQAIVCLLFVFISVFFVFGLLYLGTLPGWLSLRPRRGTCGRTR